MAEAFRAYGTLTRDQGLHLQWEGEKRERGMCCEPWEGSVIYKIHNNNMIQGYTEKPRSNQVGKESKLKPKDCWRAAGNGEI